MKKKSNRHFFMVIITLLLSNITLLAQEKTITLHLKDATLKELFAAIESQTAYRISYRDIVIDNEKNITISRKGMSITEILNYVLEKRNLGFNIVSEKSIVIFDKKNKEDVDNDKRRITGTVTDKNGEPLIGGSVTIKGTTFGTLTDMDGRFALDITGNSIIVISYLGFISQEINVRNQATLNIILEENEKLLDELVVVGYTAQKKGLITGSVVSTNFTEGMSELSVTSASKVLAGKMAGVNISTPAGQPGTQAGLSVRTGTTWNTSPILYVIDGAVSNAATFNNLNVAEIENISVLKDAASAAVYGARSDAGVILITTKKGKVGKPSINYTGSYAADFATHKVELTNLYQMGVLANQQYKNYGMTAPVGTAWSQEELDWAKSLPGQGYDALKEVWHTPYIMNHTMNISGGNERIKYYGAASYMDQGGFMKSTDYNKLNLRFNITMDITDQLQVYASISNTNTNRTWAPAEGTDATYTKLRASFNTMPAKSANGSKYITNGWAFGNAAAEADGLLGYRDIRSYNPLVNFNLTYKLPWVEGLSAKVSYMGSWKNERQKEYSTSPTFYYPVASGENNHIMNVNDEVLVATFKATGESGISSRGEWWRNEQLNFQLSYDRIFGKHQVNAVAVYEATQWDSYKITNRRRGFPLYETDQYWAANSDHNNMWADGGADTESGRASWLLLGGYNFDNKYILNISGRYDGSMNFAPNTRWGFFPAASAAWIMTQEDFLNNSKTITSLKLRASVGLTGNDAIGGWQWQTSYKTGGNYMLGENPVVNNGVQYGSLVNEYLTWEKSLSYNFAADYEFLGHLRGTLEYWYKHTYDILGNRQNSLPTTFSKTMPAENYGIVDAQGFDFSIGWHDRTKNMNWHAILNVSYGWNMVKEKDYAAGLLDWEIPVGKSTNYVATYSSYIIRTQEQLDEFKKNNPNYKNGPTGGLPIQLGSMVYVDRSGPDGVPDGQINKYDKQVFYANQNPIHYSFDLGATWKNLTVEAVFTGKLKYRKNYQAIADYHNGQMWNTEWLTDSYTLENPNASLPMMAPRDYRSYSWNDTDFWWKNASYIRLSNLNVGYKIKFDNPLGGAISSIRPFASATNLFYISVFKHWDPELSPGWSGIGYPIMRTVSGGVSVNF